METPQHIRMTPLEDIIINHIGLNGPMRFDRYMELALSHPQHGYYMTRDPFGRAGDFTTAPEISQMFGEMIAAWLMDVWMKGGKPSSFALVECGPGRGTLMADIVRASKSIPDFLNAVDIHLIETSPVLQSKQQLTLNGMSVRWHKSIDTLPQEKPLFVIGNEFFDALPVRQFLYSSGHWLEQHVGYDGAQFQIRSLPFLSSDISFPSSAPQDGDVFEYGQVSVQIMRDISRKITSQGGTFLFVDYGHLQSGYGDTVQAVKDHAYCSIFENIGECDITAHVDFSVLKKASFESGIRNIMTAEQGSFLQRLGIGLRAQKLIGMTQEPRQKTDIESALERLTAADQMGKLFKVMAGSAYDQILSGF